MLAMTHFGDAPTPTATPAQRDQYIANGLLLADAETSLRTTYSVVSAALLNITDPNAVIPDGIQKLMHDHNLALSGWTTAVTPTINAYNATKAQLASDQQGTPQMPPAFTQVDSGATNGLAGFGAINRQLRVKDIRVIYGPMHAPVVTSLGDPNTYQMHYPGSGLGGLPVLFWIAAVAIVGLTVDWAISNYRSGEIEAARATVIQSFNRVKEAESRRATFADALTRCIGTSTDIETRTACVVAASEATDRAYAGLPNPNDPNAGSSWLLWIGVAVVASAMGIGGYLIYRHNKGGGGGGGHHGYQHHDYDA